MYSYVYHLLLSLLGATLWFSAAIDVNETTFAQFQGINRDNLRRENAKMAIAYLMLGKDPSTYHWISHLATEELSVFIFVDSPEANHIYKNKNGIYIVSSTSAYCQSFGYSHLGTFAYIKKEVTCWDKAVFFFSQVAIGYDFVWILETDVFIPSLQAFQNVQSIIHSQNQNRSSHAIDLVVSKIEIDDDDINNWHWKALQPLYFPRPWYHTMACVMGLSRRMLSLLDNFAQKHHRLQFLEVLPLTLAMHNHFIVHNPPEFSTITHRNQFSCEDILHQSSNWFHPVKKPAEFIGRCIESGEWPLEMLLDRGHEN